MEEMLLINPRRNSRGQFVKRKRRVNARKRRVTARKRRRNPIAAVAMNPRRKRRARRRNPIAAVAMNPRRRTRRHRAAGYTVGSRRIRRRKMNPRAGFATFKPRAILNALIPASIGAGGAIALDIAMNYVPLPAQFQTPLYRNAARVLGAIGIGYLSSFVIGREKAKTVTVGALTVAAYGVIRDVIKTNFPQLGLSGAETYDYSDLRLGYVNPAAMVTGVGAYMPSSMPVPAPGVGAYMRGSLDTVNSLSGVVGDGL